MASAMELDDEDVVSNARLEGVEAHKKVREGKNA